MDMEDVTVAELGRKIDQVRTDLKADIADLKGDVGELKNRVVFADVHTLTTDNLRAEIARANEKATTAETIAKWALATLVALLGVVISIAVLIAQNGTGT
jgi:hypothetical protein